MCLPCQQSSQVEHNKSLLYVNIIHISVTRLKNQKDHADNPPMPQMRLIAFRIESVITLYVIDCEILLTHLRQGNGCLTAKVLVIRAIVT